MEKNKYGELYKTVTVSGKSFSLYYGYYDDADRLSRFGEPVPIYPNFYSEPIYDKDGFPFATEMQDICEHYDGRKDAESCYGCRHFERGEELIGLCRCTARRIVHPCLTDDN